MGVKHRLRHRNRIIRRKRKRRIKKRKRVREWKVKRRTMRTEFTGRIGDKSRID